MRLVGSPEAYAVQREDGTWFPVREPITPAVLVGHLARKRTLGTYVGHNVDGQTLSRTLVFDIDQGTGESDEQGDPSLATANRIRDALDLMELHSGLEFSGRKGYHVWVVLQQFRPNAELRRVGRAVLALAGAPGLEVFPKQDTVKDLGNLVKLPGGVHQVTKVANDFVGPVPLPNSDVVWEKVLAQLPEDIRAAYQGSSESRFPCMEAIQDEGVAEGGRNIQLMHLGSMLARAGVTGANVALILDNVNQKGDPLDPDELDGIIRRSPATGPLCSQLPEDRQCGDLCIRERISGLRTIPSQLRNCAEGEEVVMKLVRHTGSTVVLSHPDLQVLATGGLRGVDPDGV
jgi:hypothetical protein